MPDDARLPERELTVAEAFARLPLETPERSAWPVLAARLAATEDRPRGPRWPFALAAAAAAVLALALVLPREPTLPAGGDGTAATLPPNGTANIETLMAESARLESMLATMSGNELGSASALLLGLEFEDRLRELDAALAAPDTSDERRATLWRQRVAVLRDYTALQGTAQWVAVQGGHYDGALVATF